MFIAYTRLNNSEFARQFGRSSAWVSSMRKAIPNDVIKNIAEKFPELNRDWLAFGEGTMLKSDDNMKTELRLRVEEFIARMGLNNSQFSVSIGCHPTYVGSIDDNIKTKTIRAISRTYPDLNIEWLLLGTGLMLKSDNAQCCMNNKTVKDRLVEYLNTKRMGQQAFEKMAGLSNGYISNLKRMPGEEKLVKIYAAAPDLNPVWLLTGVGLMLKTSNQMQTKAQRLKSAYGDLIKRGLVSTQKDVADKMHASASNVSSALKGDEKVLTDRFLSRFNNAFGEIFSLGWLLTGEGSMLKTDRCSTAVGDAANAQHGDGNTYHNGADAATIDRLIGEMSEQRRSYEKQIDRLLTLLERRELAPACSAETPK